jgi:hypothetical protein
MFKGEEGGGGGSKENEQACSSYFGRLLLFEHGGDGDFPLR